MRHGERTPPAACTPTDCDRPAVILNACTSAIPEPSRDMLTVTEAAAAVGSGVDALWKALGDGRLRGERVGSRRLIRRDELDRYLQARDTRYERVAAAVADRNRIEELQLHAAGFLSPADVAAQLGVSSVVVRKRIRAGLIRSERLGHRLGVRPEWVQEYLAAGPERPSVTAPVDFTNGDWLTPTEIAELMGVTPDRVRALILSGRLRGVRHGMAPSSPHRIRREWLDEYLTAGSPPDMLPAYRTPDMLTVKEAAEQVGSPPDTLWKAVTAGLLESVQVGSRRFIRRADLDAYAQLRTTRYERNSVATRQRNEAEIEALHAEGFLTVRDAAKELGLAHAATHQRIATGQLRSEKRGRRYVTRREWIAEYLGR